MPPNNTTGGDGHLVAPAVGAPDLVAQRIDLGRLDREPQAAVLRALHGRAHQRRQRLQAGEDFRAAACARFRATARPLIFSRTHSRMMGPAVLKMSRSGIQVASQSFDVEQGLLQQDELRLDFAR